MEVDLILKVAGIGLIITVVCQVMSRAGKDDQANLVSLVGVVVILALIVEKVGGLVSSLRQIFGL
jgi:stage III sporulation protein AC